MSSSSLVIILLCYLIAQVNGECEEQNLFAAGGDSFNNAVDSMTNTYLDTGTWNVISDNFHPFYLFAGLDVNNTAYVGSSSVAIAGLYYQVDQNFSQSNNIVIEYWNGNTNSWTSTLGMALLAETPFYTFGDDYFENMQCEKLIIGNTTDWVMSTVNGITDFWLRFRITATLDANVQLEQLVRFYEQLEVYDNGYLHVTGGMVNTRIVDFQFTASLSSVFASNFPIFGIDFAANAVTHATHSLRLPSDVDTSKPIKLSFDWTANCTGNVVWELHTLPLPNGAPIFLTTQSHAQLEQSFTSIPISVTPNTQIHTLITFPVDSIILRPVRGAPDVLFLNLRRNGQSSADTCSKHAIVYATTLSYVSINFGAHSSLYWTQAVY